MTQNTQDNGTIKAAILRLIHSMPNSQERAILEMNLIWQQVVGLNIAARATICCIGKDHLIIQTDSTELMNALLGAQSYLLQRIRNLTVHARAIRSLRFKVSPGFSVSSQSEQERSSAENASSINPSDPVIQILNDLQDTELKEAIARAYMAYPKRRNEIDPETRDAPLL